MNQGALWSTFQEISDVGIDNPVHPLPPDRRVHSSQRIMRAASRPETMRAVEEIGFVNGVEHFGHCALDDFVFKRRNAERPLPFIGLGNVGSPNRQGPISVRLKARMQRLEIALQFAFIRRHRDPIHAGRCPPPQAPKRPFERRDVNVMEQRREQGLARRWAASFTRTRCRCRGLQLCVWTCAFPSGLPNGRGLPSARLVAFAVINGTTPRSATLPSIEPILWSPSAPSPSGDQSGAFGRASQVLIMPVRA
jgi:hypothetical protein